MAFTMPQIAALGVASAMPPIASTQSGVRMNVRWTTFFTIWFASCGFIAFSARAPG